MSQKKLLHQDVESYFHHTNEGTVHKRRFQENILHKITNDFYKITAVPSNWHTLTKNHVERLVSFWLSRNIKPSSIMNYLACLRYFLRSLGHSITNIDNLSLGLQKNRTTLKPKIEINTVFESLQNPCSKLLFGLQGYFGLTRQESLKFSPSVHLLEKELFVSRNISHNSCDRIVPIASTIQETFLAFLLHVLGEKESLSQYQPLEQIKRNYEYDMDALGLAKKIQYRFLYVPWRLKELMHLPLTERKSMIQKELGIRAKSTLWAYCHE